jgi:16S rRNA (cytidine1402-2'-O)-methyltransferase
VAGSLVICPTPIGNLSDVTLRLLSVLREADVIACEDTRVTRKLLERHVIKPKALISYHEHNERRAARQLLGRIERGELVAPAAPGLGLELDEAAVRRYRVA